MFFDGFRLVFRSWCPSVCAACFVRKADRRHNDPRFFRAAGSSQQRRRSLEEAERDTLLPTQRDNPHTQHLVVQPLVVVVVVKLSVSFATFTLDIIRKKDVT